MSGRPVPAYPWLHELRASDADHERVSDVLRAERKERRQLDEDS
ncbi:hypothetical protein [Kribbella qitaiheensis]|nr:hypothetical protein [Kribbella qitaiheensis]